ncbi:MAG TPA: HD-GYP domain-containing protein [bacterium]|nr:HD-GYP domain-containing protein [bacterium]
MSLTRAVRAYMLAVILAGGGLLLLLRGWAVPPTTNLVFWLPLFAGIGLVPVAGYCQICVAKDVTANMASAVMMAMLLLLPPGFAALGAGAGIALLYTLKHWPPLLVAFNAAQTALTLAVAGVAYRLLAPGVLAFSTAQAVPVLVTMALFFLIDSLTITIAAVLQGGTPFRTTWVSSFGRTAVPYLSTLLLGVVAAVTFVHAPLLTPVLVLPVVAVYRALRNEQIVLRQTQATIELLADTIDRRDPYTFAHSQRVAVLAQRIAAQLGLSPEACRSVARAARVHDVGKLGIPDAVLRKPGPLTDAELEQVRKHAAIGAEIVGRLSEYGEGKEFIRYHHERYDGRGYFGLVGEHIPLGARIIAVADALDAMTSSRPYREALPDASAVAELVRGQGTQFDPRVVQAVQELLAEHRHSVRAILGDVTAALPEGGRAAATG